MKPTVIVVDDERFDRACVRRRMATFPQFGEVIEVDDGDTFLDRFFTAGATVPTASEEVPALVLMDIKMRRMNGFETLMEMQKRMAAGLGPKHVIALMLSSSASQRDQHLADAIPIVRGYLTKPFSAEHVDRILGYYPGNLAAV